MKTNSPLASDSSATTRRHFLKRTASAAGLATAGGVLANLRASAQPAASAPSVARNAHAAHTDLIQLALIGCGGRGTGAAVNAFGTAKLGPVKLVAMADVFAARLNDSLANLKKQHADLVDVPRDRQFVEFDGYRKAMDCLKPGDVVILATPPAFRWVHFTYAIQKGLHVFMEKPVTVDGPTSKRMFALAKQASAKNLKCGVGLMSRHARHLQELVKRVQDGEIGEIILQRGYRMHGPAGYFSSLPKPPGISDLMYQVQRFHSFIWASGGNFSDFYIHIIDHLGWIKNAWPVKAHALGGRHYRQSPEGIPYVDQNFDVYSVEYTYADGTKFYFDGRCMTGCLDNFSSYIHGTKGSAITSRSGDCGGPSATFRSQLPRRADMIWQSNVKPEEADPYQNEWNDLMAAIRQNQPYNEVEYGVQASLVTAMGRMAAHTGQEITYEDMLNCPHELAPTVDRLTFDSPAPLQPDANGRYPLPQPGILKDREY